MVALFAGTTSQSPSLGGAPQAAGASSQPCVIAFRMPLDVTCISNYVFWFRFWFTFARLVSLVLSGIDCRRRRAQSPSPGARTPGRLKARRRGRQGGGVRSSCP